MVIIANFMKKNYYQYIIYRFVHNRFLISLRLFLVFSLLFYPIFYSSYTQKNYFLLLFLFIFNEIFILFYLNKKVYPSNPSELLQELMSFPTRSMYESSSNPSNLIKKLVKKPSVKFVLERVDVAFDVKKEYGIGKEEILEKSAGIIKEIGGKYINDCDLFISFLILLNQKNKLLEKKDLGENDLINILIWARLEFALDAIEKPSSPSIGEGLGEFIVYGWNYEVKKYALDFSTKVEGLNYIPSNLGREEEFNSLISYLSKETSNSVIIIGEPGVGKTSLVETFTDKSLRGELLPPLKNKKIFELYIDRLISGSNTQGELESKLTVLIDELEHTKNVIVFIQNIENIFGAGGFNVDLSGVLFEYLKDGRIQIIGTTTPGVFKTNLSRKETINKLFEQLRLEEPSKSLTFFILFQRVKDIEKRYGVKFSYKSILSSVELSSRYIVNRYLPGKAMDLLEDLASIARATSKKIVREKDVLEKIEEKTKVVISEPNVQEKKILLNLEDEMHKRLIGQEEAIKSVASAVRRLRSGLTNDKRPVSVFLFLGPTGVGKTETAKVLSRIYFGSEGRIIRLDMSEYEGESGLDKLLESDLAGEKGFLNEVEQNPSSLILLDEFEKSDSRVQDLFLQVFDEGRITSNSGKTISFLNTIIIATSNAGSEYIRENFSKKQTQKNDLIDYLLKNQTFKPELINRFDDVIVFKPLNWEEIKKVTKLLLDDRLKAMEEMHLYITSTPEIIDKIVENSYNTDFGARNVRRYIDMDIEDYLSRVILEGAIKKGEKKKLAVDNNGNAVII